MRREKMMRMLMIIGVLVAGAPAHASRTVVWDKTVIPLSLVVGVEQLVHFNDTVSPGLTELLSKKDFFRIMSTNGTVYMTALQPFEQQRVKFRTDEGEYILVDLSARTEKTPPAKVDAVHVVLGDKDGESRTGAASHAATHRVADQPRVKAVGLFDVLRYAAQSMYSPARVIKPVAGLVPVSLKIRSDLKTLYKGPQRAQLSIKAVRGWRSGDIYVTVLKVKNHGDHAVLFDPSKLQHAARRAENGVSNQFTAVGLLNRSRKLSTGSNTQRSTYVFVATDHPFSSVLVL